MVYTFISVPTCKGDGKSQGPTFETFLETTWEEFMIKCRKALTLSYMEKAV